MKQSKGEKSLSSPLALLEELSHSLIAHLERACGEALLNSEKQLRKLDREQEKLQARIDKRLAKLEAAISAGGKAKARSKLTTEIAEMEKLLAELQQDRVALLGYIEQLRSEITRTLELGIGISDVGRAAGAAQKPAARVAQSKAPKLPEPVASAPAAPTAEPAVAQQPAPRRRRAAKPAEAAAPRSDAPVSEQGATSAKPAPSRRRRNPRPAASADKPAGNRRRPAAPKPDQE